MSEELKPLEMLRKEDSFACQICNNYICSWGNYKCPHFNYIKSLEKSLKALEIIKEKKIDVELFIDTIPYGLEEYNEVCCSWATLTPEEYELLREVLL